MSELRAWSFLAIKGTRQYGGNSGYDDELSAVYRYDSNVANHRQVGVGDIALIRTRTSVAGLAKISRIEKGAGVKERLRCPECRQTNIKKRKTMFPAWVCRNGHAFNNPLSETEAVTTYSAHYGETFSPCSSELTLDQLQGAVLRPTDQMSIKEIDLARLEPFLGSRPGIDDIILDVASRLSAPEGTEEGDPEACGSVIDERRKVLREIALRRGQARFRRMLIQRYGACCQISRCEFPGLLEAAHIRPFCKSGDNGVRNGLLLRSDLHTLFDLGLLGIEPSKLEVALHPAVHSAGYSEFATAILFLNGARGPDPEALRQRWDFFQSKLGAD